MKTPSILRIVRVPRTDGGLVASSSVALSDGPDRFQAEAVFPDAHRAENGELQDLHVSFETDSVGRQIGTPKVSVASATALATTGPCAPICVKSEDGKRQRCFFPCGGGSGPVLLGSPSMVIEFASEATDKLKLDVKLWHQDEGTAPELSVGEIDLQ